MKGTFCGRRAIPLAMLLGLLAAIAPAVARADVLGGSVSALPSTPTAPAVPVPVAAPVAPVSVPAPATPSVPVAPVQAVGPVAGVTAGVANPSVSIGKPSVSVSAPVAKAAVTSRSAHIRSSLRPATKAATTVKTVARRTAPKAPAEAAVPMASDVSFSGSTMTIKFHPTSVVFKKKSPWRKLTWNAGNDDWQSGCTKLAYTGCAKEPPLPVDNRCYPEGNAFTPPPGASRGTEANYPVSDEIVLFDKGSMVMWSRAEQTYGPGPNGTRVPGTRIHIKRHSVGFEGTGLASGYIYKLGQNDQDETDFFVPRLPDPSTPTTAPFKMDLRTWELLLVSPGPQLTAIPGMPVPGNMWFTQHMVVTPTQTQIRWSIVCSKGQKPKDDPDQGSDHDRSGDYEKYRHHREDFYGYNNDQPSSWDQNDY